MGNKVSIDKHLSSVNDILDVKPSYFKKKIRFDSNIPENITHHVKVVSKCSSKTFQQIWKYFKGQQEDVQCKPISLQNLLNNCKTLALSTITLIEFTFSKQECYLILLVYKQNISKIATLSLILVENELAFSFPHSMWGIVDSYTNLTPRGLNSPITTS